MTDAEPVRFVAYPDAMHCADLHDQIAFLLRKVGEGTGYPLTKCARCGRVMVREVEENDEGNGAMEVCSTCSWDLARAEAWTQGRASAFEDVHGDASHDDRPNPFANDFQEEG